MDATGYKIGTTLQSVLQNVATTALIDVTPGLPYMSYQTIPDKIWRGDAALNQRT